MELEQVQPNLAEFFAEVKQYKVVQVPMEIKVELAVADELKYLFLAVQRQQ